MRSSRGAFLASSAVGRFLVKSAGASRFQFSAAEEVLVCSARASQSQEATVAWSKFGIDFRAWHSKQCTKHGAERFVSRHCSHRIASNKWPEEANSRLRDFAGPNFRSHTNRRAQTSPTLWSSLNSDSLACDRTLGVWLKYRRRSCSAHVKLATSN